MSTGQVKWFNNAKGFGFILPDEGGDDLFAHYSAIGMDGYKTLKAGQLVSFDTIEGPKGLHAANIHTVNDASTSISIRQALNRILIPVRPLQPMVRQCLQRTMSWQPRINGRSNRARLM